MGKHPKEAFLYNVEHSYGTADLNSLDSHSLNHLLDKMGNWFTDILMWLYPHHVIGSQMSLFGREFPNYRLRKTIDYAREIYNERTGKLSRDHPKCFVMTFTTL